MVELGSAGDLIFDCLAGSPQEFQLIPVLGLSRMIVRYMGVRHLGNSGGLYAGCMGFPEDLFCDWLVGRFNTGIPVDPGSGITLLRK